MLNKRSFIYISACLAVFSIDVQAQEQASDMLTLFTTAKERQLIDANRYKTDKLVQQQTISEAREETVEAQAEELKVSFKLSGFTLTKSGQNVAWVNGKPYENGAELEDGSIITISGKNKVRVRIKTPDGKYHSLSTGKTEDIGYYKPLTEG